MERGVRRGSNTLELIAIIKDVSEEGTFTERCALYLKVLDARISRTVQGDPDWAELIRLKGHVQNFIRFDSQSIELEKEPSESALIAAA